MSHMHPTVSRREFLAGAAALTSGAATRHATAARAPETTSGPVLHFAQPASKWPNALPVGNGRLGAVVFGEPGLERIQLNEESIWDGEPNRDRTNPKAGAAIPKIRELLFADRIAEAEAMATSDVLSVPRRMPCYQTLGDMHLDFGSLGLKQGTVPQEYRLQLDLDTAIVTTTFAHDGVLYRREIFSSAPDQVIVVRLSASKPGKISFLASMDRPRSYTTEVAGKNALRMTGQALPVNDNPGLPDKEHQTGVRFYAELRAFAEGGSVVADAAGDRPAIEAKECDVVWLLLDCATSYRFPARNGAISGVDAAVLTGDAAAMRAAVDRNLSVAERKGYIAVRTRHIADHQRYFRRVDLNLGTDVSADVPTDERVKRMKAGGEDVHLLSLYFQYGRYMLISSSRPGTLAANLQGIWNESVDPPWGSKYTVNINAQMNYWFAESANLSECHLPLFDLLGSTVAPGTKTAKQMYGASGSVVHHNTDIWGDGGPIDGLGGGVWAMGACWLSLHLWKHFLYTGDRRFLAERVYPGLRENAVFLLDYMVRDPHTGHLVTGPSCSPENAYVGPDHKAHNLCMGPTMDISIVRAVLTRFLQSAEALRGEGKAGQDAALHERARAALQELPPFQVGHDGRLQEWPSDYNDHEPGHRHISHLFGLFPEDQITVDATPELARAARLVLDKRLAAGGGSTGWSRSWIINCMARLGDGEACYANILELFRQSVRPNLFDVCGLKENSPFQIDGNLGAPNGFIEMLLQSHGHTPLQVGRDTRWNDDVVVLRLLPALPKAWQQGSFRGLRARSGMELDCTWSDGKIVTAKVKTNLDCKVRFVLPAGQTLRGLKRAENMLSVPAQGNTGSISLQAGRAYSLELA